MRKNNKTRFSQLQKMINKAAKIVAYRYSTFYIFCFVPDEVSLCSLGCSGIWPVDQAGLELLEVHLLLLPRCLD